MSRSEIGSMVSGMGMGMRVLELLMSETKTQGGDPEVFNFITRPRFKPNLERICKAIAECDWRIPASEMCKRAARNASNSFELDRAEREEAKHLWWYSACGDFGIPYESYDDDPQVGHPAIPPTLHELLQGRKMQYPLIIEFGQRKDVVVNWGTKDNVIIPRGQLINTDTVITLGIADAKYFDFDK